MSARDEQPAKASGAEVSDLSDNPAAASQSSPAPPKQVEETESTVHGQDPPCGVDSTSTGETQASVAASLSEAQEQAHPGSSITPGVTTASTTPAERQSPVHDQAKAGESVTSTVQDSQQSANSQLEASTSFQEDEKGITHTGKCKWFDSRRGFGFITPDDGSEDVFVHQQCILADGFRSLREGEKVEYKVQTDEKGRKKAVSISGPGGVPVQGEVGAGFYRGRGTYPDAWYGSRGYSRRGMTGGTGRGMGNGLSRGQHAFSNRGGMFQGYDRNGMQDIRRAPYFQFGAYGGVPNYLPTDYAIVTNPYSYFSQPGPADYPYTRYYPGN